MSSTKRKLESLVEAARARARAEGRRVLVSLSERIDSRDPLAVLEFLAQNSSPGDTAHELSKAGRMYWARPGDGFAMAGVGAAATFEHSGARRFVESDIQWNALTDGAIIEGDSRNLPGSGPVLMGGFSFDPDGPRTAMWSGFESSHLTIPALLVTSIFTETSITLNIVVAADGQPGTDPGILASLADSISSGASSPTFDIEDPVAPELNRTNLSTAEEWRETVEAAIAEIEAGRLEKVVVARATRVSSSETIDMFAMLRHLRSAYVQSFVFAIWQSGRAFVGASPERLIRITGRDVEASSLAGTIRRGATRSEDAANVTMLLGSAKDLAEHAAVRNELHAALSESCDDVSAPRQPSILTLPHVHHLHTSIHARLRENGSVLGLVAQLHPTPAVGGSPRDAALRFLEEHENLDRGWYAAPVGWLGLGGGEFAVALRCAIVDEDEAVLFAGCGIVADSDPDLEYAESSLKLQAMDSSIAASLPGPSSDLVMTTVTERSA
jgi:isochorismate synthase